MQRAIDDIDGRDVDNPLLVTCYVNEMYEHFNQVERDFNVNCNYMAKQDFVNEKMRSILVDWLVEVHLKFKMVPESLYMTVSIIDRYLEMKQVRRSKLQLVGVAALLIAAKYEEIYPPELRDLVYITDRAYNKQEILEMESEIVNTLEYKFTVPTVHSFLCRYLKAAHADRTMVQLACYLTERTLQEYTMLRFLPSTIAATAVMVARKSLNRHPWSPTLMKYTNMDERDLASCGDEMRATVTDTSDQQAVYRKYSSQKFGGVAKMSLMF
ncbi:cyclin-like protein [Ochromonadaceae sp. CCMP2298]|nr:cyclin-like protein [Ochromonadaceae sp. CCMP2298]